MIGWAVETLVAATLLMLLVLAIRGAVARRFGPHAAYALWALPALRMVLPPIPDAWRPVDFAPIGAATDPGQVMMFVPIADVPALPQGWGMADVPVAVVALWAVGAIGFVAWHIVAHRRFCARILSSGQGRGVAQGHVRVIETRHAAGPLAFGVWRRYVAMPADFAERYDPQEQALALAHELGHHARGDLLANWAALVILGCHWFNPVAWRAFRAFRADQEMACDAMVLARATPRVRHAYASAIVKSAHGGAMSAACHLHSINELKGRLVMLSKHRVMSPTTRRIASTATLALAVVALGATASGTEAAETIRTGVERVTGVELAAVELQAAEALAPIALVTAQAAQAAPITTPEVPADPADPAPPVSETTTETRRTTTGADGKPRQIILRQVRRDGPMSDADVDAIVASVPEVIERKCGIDGPNRRQVSINETSGTKRRIIICTDRAEQIGVEAAVEVRLAHASAVEARSAARAGLAAAMSGLRAARQTLATQPGLSAEQRREALEDIDDSIREVREEFESEG
ncbi:M56 family metallopeptidase [Sphingomonas sp. CFBP 13720]|uniref:M56 family metallopeptidase n=1 Tax=Sphingomonas sp. CFBP 13720 TaxID=2775302 RepID=UPI00177EAF82|nr:M56 family metallopeptidase [Sphingomonas sp. CFBP 13720]MBD8679238.1 peptidase M56 [Sphingomonas sp. CFBP 13720]